MRLITPIGRLYWNKGLTIHKESNPKFAVGSNKYTYNATIAINSKTPEGAEFFKKFFEEYSAQKLKHSVQLDNVAKDGSEKPCFKEGEGLFEGYYLITGTNANKARPVNLITMIDKKSQPCGANIFYRGCKVRAQIELNGYNIGKNQGVSCKLLTLQFAGDGEEIVYKGDILEPINSEDSIEDNLLREFA